MFDCPISRRGHRPQIHAELGEHERKSIRFAISIKCNPSRPFCRPLHDSSIFDRDFLFDFVDADSTDVDFIVDFIVDVDIVAVFIT